MRLGDDVLVLDGITGMIEATICAGAAAKLPVAETSARR
jgi:hypothetical protein